MFKPLILSNIAICWGAFPWFSMVLEIPSSPPRQRQAPKVFLLLCTADPYHLPGSLPGPGSPYPLRSRASPPHLPVSSPVWREVSSPSSVHRQLPGSRQRHGLQDWTTAVFFRTTFSLLQWPSFTKIHKRDWYNFDGAFACSRLGKKYVK